MSITINPQQTTNAAGSFDVETSGYIQGTALNDPAVRFWLAGGVLAVSETNPMWGGVGIQELVPAGISGRSGSSSTLGGTIKRATGVANLTGFSVFDQNHAAINSPGSPVPLSGAGMQVNFYRFGSGARIPVNASPTLLDAEGNLITQNVSWDYENQILTPYVSTTISAGTYATATTISSGTYNATTGAVSLTTNAAHGLLPGDSFTLSGMTGTGSFATLDGTFVATVGTTGSTLDFAVAPSLTMTITGGNLGTVGVTLTTAAAHNLNVGDTFLLSGLTGTNAALLDGEQVATAGTTGSTLNFVATSGLGAGSITGGTVGSGGAINVRILEVQVGNSMTVVYNPATGAATWNRSGTTAVILI